MAQIVCDALPYLGCVTFGFLSGAKFENYRLARKERRVQKESHDV